MKYELCTEIRKYISITVSFDFFRFGIKKIYFSSQIYTTSYGLHSPPIEFLFKYEIG